MNQHLDVLPVDLFALADFCDGLCPKHLFMSADEGALALGVVVVGEMAEAEELEVEGDVEVFKVVLFQFDVFR